jgi:hypothetical protein
MLAVPHKELQKRDLCKGLRHVDKTTGKSWKKSDDLKSTGDASSANSSTNKSNGSSRRSVVSDAEQAERILKEQAKLAREQRRAEEAKLKRLQEETRLLEERTRSEEVRLKALKEETKIWEAKRVEEEARAKIEAKVAQEKEKLYFSELEHGERERSKKMQDRKQQDSWKNESNAEVIPESEDTTSLSVGSPDFTNQNDDSVPRRRSYTHSCSQTTKKKFGGSPDNIEHLPPAFQVLLEQSKRIEK